MDRGIIQLSEQNKQIGAANMKLQYQLSNGNWVNCKKSDTDDRTDEFLARCAEYKKISTDEVVAILATGKSVANGSGWSNECRDGEIADAKSAAFAAQHASAVAADTRPVMCCKLCGQTGRRGAYPFSTNPSSGRCDDCC